MPYEVVQYPATEGISGTELTAHWSKSDTTGEGVVQLAVTNHVWGQIDPPEPDALCHTHPAHEHRGHNDCQPCKDRNASLNRVDPVTAAHGGVTEVSGGSVVGEFDPSVSIVTKPLTRAEINRMIRVLRTARDQAFGADA